MQCRHYTNMQTHPSEVFKTGAKSDSLLASHTSLQVRGTPARAPRPFAAASAAAACCDLLVLAVLLLAGGSPALHVAIHFLVAASVEIFCFSCASARCSREVAQFSLSVVACRLLQSVGCVFLLSHGVFGGNTWNCINQ